MRSTLELGSLAVTTASYIAATSPATLVLTAGQSIESPNGRYRLVMQTDGNLVVYGPSGAQWATGTSVPHSYAAVQGDGNFVVYDRTDGSARWASRTSGLYPRLAMQDDGNLILYAGSGAGLWDTKGWTGGTGVLAPAVKTTVGSLASGQRVYSPNAAYVVVMQGDGNLVEYDGSGRPRWASNTVVAGSRLVAQGDGNLVVYTPQGRGVWTSNTYGNPGAFAMLGNDGALAIYRTDGVRIWTA